MQLDFHYYATYCAAALAGYTHEESLEIAYSAQFVYCCTRTLLSKIGGPPSASIISSDSWVVAAEGGPPILESSVLVQQSTNCAP